jgi:PAS domain S-box-containing protein
MKKGKTLPEDSSLRQKAEAVIENLNSGKVNPQVAPPEQSLCEAETQKLIQELQIYQIELEMQNEELQQAVEKATIATALYDFAPTGYFTIGTDSTIIQLNLSGAKMLGKDRSVLTNSYLSQFVTPETKPVFSKFLETIFETGHKQNCEIGLAIEGKPVSFSYLEGMVTGDKNKCLVVAVDITERKRAEEALKANYSLLRIAGETAKFGGWSINIAENKVIWSDEVAAIHEMPAGYSPALDEGINFYAPEWRSKITKVVSDCVKNGIPFDQEMELITAKGNRIWVRVAGEAIRAENGKIVRIQGAFQDITERKLADHALRESEEKWRKLVNTIPDYVALYDRDGKYLFLNHFADGFSIKDIEGKIYTDFLAEESKLAYKQTFELARHTKTNQRVEHKALGDNRSIRDYESFFVPIFENGKLANMMVIARDITERKQTENDLKNSNSLLTATLESTADGIMVVDKMGKVTSYNKKFIELWRIPESIVSTYDDKKLMFFVLGQLKDPEGFMKKVNELYLNDEEVSFDTIEFNDGRIYERYSQAQLFEGKSIGRVWSFRNVTDRNQAEQALKESEARLLELNATKDKFFSIIAHDLKSPFNSILGFSSLLTRQLKEGDHAAIERYASIIQNSSQQALDLLINLLEWSRSQTGRMLFNPESIDIVDLINQSTELLNASALQKSITIYSEMPVNLPGFADKAMISTILRNLISNAIKFTNTGGKIVISTEQRPNELVISVLDSGVGMNNESIGKLFRIEENYSTLGTQKEKGTGLGLLLCKEFVDKHGGRIGVESESGKGSKFFFSIPNHKAINSLC